MSLPLDSVTFSDRDFRDALGGFASGVTVITTLRDSEPVGMTCQSFYSVSVNPPLVSFSVGTTSQSLPALRSPGGVVVNFLGADQQHLSAQFARSGTDKWAGVEWLPASANEAPTLAGAAGWVAGEIVQEVEAGDHVIFIVAVHDIGSEPDADPLVFHRGKYRALTPHDEQAG